MSLEKENRRLARRLQRLEDNVRRLESFQDSNSTLQSRLLTELEAERARSERLLLNVLPQRIIDRLAAGETLIADRHESVSVLFSDVVGFTTISARLAPAELIEQLNELFSGFDEICERTAVEKIKTVGDAYLVIARSRRWPGPRDGDRRDGPPDGRAGRDAIQARRPRGRSGSASTPGRPSPASSARRSSPTTSGATPSTWPPDSNRRPSRIGSTSPARWLRSSRIDTG